MIDNQLIGTPVRPNHLTGHKYVDFLQNELPLIIGGGSFGYTQTHTRACYACIDGIILKWILEERVGVCMDWIDVAEDRDRYWAPVNAAILATQESFSM